MTSHTRDHPGTVRAGRQRAAVPTVRLEVPDYDQGLRGKLLRADKLAPGKRAALCTIVYGLSITDEVTDTPLSNARNGYPDAFAVPDENTRVDLYWRENTQAVIADMMHADGRMVDESPRSVCRQLLAGYEQLDLQPVFGYEYEVYVTHADELTSGLRALGRTNNAYSLARLAEAEPLAEEFLARMESVNVPIEAFHSELGPGFFEFALAPADALTAADRAARARQYFRELCAQQGLRATFMAKLHIEHSGSGGHVHQSLCRNGANVFSGAPGQLSDLGSAYLGGLLDTMGELTVLFNPFLNSFKRISAEMFVSPRANWGYDNRNAACRAILNTGAESARVEHRRPGADANPYLVAAGMLAGGLYGLRKGLDPGPPLEPGEKPATGGGALPPDLAAAVSVFEKSPVAHDLLGTAFVESYTATRRGELDAFDRWWRGTVTDWELARYLEHL